jgi:hypothetical protein
MGVDISTLKEPSFEFETKSLGRLCCWCGEPSISRYRRLVSLCPPAKRVPRDFAIALLTMVAERAGAQGSSPTKLTKADTAGLLENEVEEFAKRYLENSIWLIDANQAETNRPELDSPIVLLLKSFTQYEERARIRLSAAARSVQSILDIGERFRRATDSLSVGFGGLSMESTLNLIRQNDSIMRAAGGLSNLLADDVMRQNPAISTATRGMRDALDATRTIAGQIGTTAPFALVPPKTEILLPPPNPIRETNHLLDDLNKVTQGLVTAVTESTDRALTARGVSGRR